MRTNNIAVIIGLTVSAAVLLIGGLVLRRQRSAGPAPVAPIISSQPAHAAEPAPQATPSNRPQAADPVSSAVPPAPLVSVDPASPAPLSATPAAVPNRAIPTIEAHPERHSTLTAPTVFDVARYQADPAAYCADVIPGRIWQVAQPGKEVPQISIAGEASFETKPGGTVVLSVRAAPGAPVTFHSADLGAFTNSHTTITVQADDHGVASAPWVATPGTTGSCHILAASPLSSGQVELFIYVQD